MEGEVNPVRDLEIIAEELRKKDEERLMADYEKKEKFIGRINDKKEKAEFVSDIFFKNVTDSKF